MVPSAGRGRHLSSPASPCSAGCCPPRARNARRRRHQQRARQATCVKPSRHRPSVPRRVRDCGSDGITTHAALLPAAAGKLALRSHYITTTDAFLTRRWRFVTLKRCHGLCRICSIPLELNESRGEAHDPQALDRRPARDFRGRIRRRRLRTAAARRSAGRRGGCTAAGSGGYGLTHPGARQHHGHQPHDHRVEPGNKTPGQHRYHGSDESAAAEHHRGQRGLR